MLQFLAGERKTIQIGEIDTQRLVISKSPLTAHIAFGLDESQIGLAKPLSEDIDEVVLDLEDEGLEMKEGEGDE